MLGANVWKQKNNQVVAEMLSETCIHNVVIVPATKTIIGTCAFRSAASYIWNKLSDDIVKSPSLLSVSNKLKTHYFRLAF